MNSRHHARSNTTGDSFIFRDDDTLWLDPDGTGATYVLRLAAHLQAGAITNAPDIVLIKPARRRRPSGKRSRQDPPGRPARLPAADSRPASAFRR